MNTNQEIVDTGRLVPDVVSNDVLLCLIDYLHDDLWEAEEGLASLLGSDPEDLTKQKEHTVGVSIKNLLIRHSVLLNIKDKLDKLVAETLD